MKRFAQQQRRREYSDHQAAGAGESKLANRVVTLGKLAQDLGTKTEGEAVDHDDAHHPPEL